MECVKRPGSRVDPLNSTFSEFLFSTQSKIAKRHVLVQQSYRVSKKNKYIFRNRREQKFNSFGTVIVFVDDRHRLWTYAFCFENKYISLTYCFPSSRRKTAVLVHTRLILYFYIVPNKNRRIHVKRRNALDLHLSLRNAPTKVPLSTSTKSEKTVSVSKPRQFAKSS